MPTPIKPYILEADFEEDLTKHLLNHGWNEVIMHPSEDDLITNWANIIYDNNRSIDCLGSYPLTKSEMQQVIDLVNACSSPYEVNKLINGKQVCIKRDCKADAAHYGKNVYLKIFDPMEISAGQSRYQIVRQPHFKTSEALKGNRRGDLMLLINGMPVVHIELKRSKVDVSQACYQLKRYAHEGIFAHGIFKMVQIFVAMTPEETLYFANPGREDRFAPQYYFHWEDFNNTVVSDWQRVATDLLSIPMAHQMVGFYTIADDKDQTLKVLRSYQYFAASKISDCVAKTNWDDHQHRGGYVWHTTGSGKTMTSFKSAQLISQSGDADKVVFLLDRIELAVQSLDEFKSFASDADTVQDTVDTTMLLSRLKSTSADDRLIVTSIQKMSNIKAGDNIPQKFIDEIGSKRLVFIVDECHRSVFGEMLIGIKHTFPRALLFGFTGTPVFEVNAKNEITTETIFGDMLHKYTIANGIPDGNVLGFDPYMVNTYDENMLRELAAFRQIDAKLKARCAAGETFVQPTDEQRLRLIDEDDDLRKVYDHFVHDLKMPESYMENGKTVHGIEYYLPKDIYQRPDHHLAVAQNIVESRERVSKNGKFHAMLATKNIPEAIAYYDLFRQYYPSLHVAAVFDSNIDNSDQGIVREDAIKQMLDDYNARFGTTFAQATYALYKKDVAKRLSHKAPYIGIDHDHSQQIDLLIVVTQMLTGFDSKWINTLYVDKVMKYVDIIQAFSRTNRLFGPDKPFGIIKYYAYPYTMEQNINDALEVYANRPLGVFVDKLERNLTNINQRYLNIRSIFLSEEIRNFEKLPTKREDKNMFAKCFSELTHLLEAAKLQGFVWEKADYEFQHGDTYTHVKLELDEATYQVLLQRYRELFQEGGTQTDTEKWEYAIDTYITETGTGTIDAEYIDSKFQKFVKNLYAEGPSSAVTREALEELCKTFASLSQKDQRTAIIILHDIQSGDLHLDSGKTIYDYITAYQSDELHKQILNLCEATGLNASQLEEIMSLNLTEKTLNENNRYDKLKLTFDMQKTSLFLNRVLGKEVPYFMRQIEIDQLLRAFIFDPVMRERILLAWLHDDITVDTAAKVQAEEAAKVTTVPPAPQEEQTDIAPDIVKIKTSIKAILQQTLKGVLPYMRGLDEVIDSVFYVIDTPSLDSLDGVGLYVMRALKNVFSKEKPNLIDKSVGYNLLVTQFEAYLKKLYYLMTNEEVSPQYEGDNVTWKDVIHAIHPLWNLKYSKADEYQLLYQYLMLVKGWRNEQSHISPTASDQEVNAAISITLTMYFFATGSCITDLECAGHDVESTPSAPKPYLTADFVLPQAAE